MTINLGDKYEQIKAINEYGFDYVGSEFVITKATESIVMGKGIDCGVIFGIERDKLLDYFAPVIEEVKEDVVKDALSFDGDIKIIRSNKVTVVILKDGSKGKSKCHPEDTYDPAIGYEIAYNRALIKSHDRKLKKLVKQNP